MDESNRLSDDILSVDIGILRRLQQPLFLVIISSSRWRFFLMSKLTSACDKLSRDFP